MSTHIGSLLFGRKWILAISLPVLIAAWWAFRPEKLWINQKVNEAAPFASSSDPQPLYTGRLQGTAHQTSGRATVYKAADGTQYLRLTDFSIYRTTTPSSSTASDFMPSSASLSWSSSDARPSSRANPGAEQKTIANSGAFLAKSAERTICLSMRR
jgi:hypothetical protein